MEATIMLQKSPRTDAFLLVLALCISCCAITGCVESNFRIASESRLPRGLAIPPGLTRADVSVTLDFYTMGQAKFTLRDKSGKKLTTVTGKTKGDPMYLRTTPQAPAPRRPVYALVVINGITEIIENRRADDIVYVTDDPGIREELLAGRGVQ